MDDMLRTGQQRQVSLDDDAVKTVIHKNQEALKKLREGFHRSPPRMVWSDNQNHLSWQPVESTACYCRSQTALPRDFKGAALGYH